MLTPKKCAFSTGKLDYLGRMIRPDLLGRALNLTDAINDVHNLTSVTIYKLFHGCCNVFRRVLLNVARFLGSLDNKLQNEELRNWTELTKDEPKALETPNQKLLFPWVWQWLDSTVIWRWIPTRPTSRFDGYWSLTKHLTKQTDRILATIIDGVR